MTTTKRTRATAKTAKTSVDTKAMRQQKVIDYIADGYQIDMSRTDLKEHAEARASVQCNKYASVRSRRMCDAPNEIIPSAQQAKEAGIGYGYCVKVTNLKLNKMGYNNSYVVSCPSKEKELMESSANSKTCKFEVVAIKYNLNRYRGYGRQFKTTKAEAEAYIDYLKNLMDTDRNKGKYDTYRY